MSRYLPTYEPDPFPSRGPAPAPKRLRIEAAAHTDVGLERSNNEDRAAFSDLGSGDDLTFEPAPTAAARLIPEAGAFVGLVCDGMGGEAGGEIASAVAVETIVPFLRSVSRANDCAEGRMSEGALAHAMVASIEAASARIKERARVEPRLSRMGTTATLAVVCDHSLLCAQVGDSRAYVLRGRELAQITRDQTMAELLRRSGNVVDIDDIVGSHVILQALGSSSRLEVALTHTPLENGDVVLLCSDGLSGVLSDHVIATVLAQHERVEEACAALIQQTLERGAPDNVTCVVFRVSDLMRR